MKETPTRDLMVADEELAQVKSAPMRSFSGPEAALSFPKVGCWYGSLLKVWYRATGSVLRPRKVLASPGGVSKSAQK